MWEAAIYKLSGLMQYEKHILDFISDKNVKKHKDRIEISDYFSVFYDIFETRSLNKWESQNNKHCNQIKYWFLILIKIHKIKI